MNSYMRFRTKRRWTAKGGRSSGRKYIRLANSFLIALLLFTIVPAGHMLAQTTSPTDYTFVECGHIEEVSLRDELNDITQSVFEEKQGGLDLDVIVNRYWIELNLDAAVDTAVDEAIEQVSNEENWWSRVRSGWSAERAEEFTENVAKLAFGSDDFRAAVEQLSKAVADELAVEIQVMVDVSASSALLCVEEFIGATFSRTMATVLDEQIKQRLASITIEPELETSFEEILKGNWGSLSGLGIIVGSQLSKALAQKVAGGIVAKVVTRILGKAASAVVPVAGWVVGIVLILWDLWEAGKGALPQIEKEFKGEDVKALVRKEIANSVKAELETILPKLGRTVADDMYKLWQAFLEEFEQVLEIARSNPDFRSILNGAHANDVGNLKELVSVGISKLGDSQLTRLIQSGQFKLILDLPPEAVEILRFDGDPDLVMHWGELAGSAIDQVVGTKLYQFSSPSDFMSREGLNRVLALGDESVIKVLMSLDAEKRNVLLKLSSAHTRWILTVLTAERVKWLAEYMEELTPNEAVGLVEYTKRNRGLLSILMGSKDLQTKLPFVFRLSERNSSFQSILNETTSEQFQKLSELVAVSGESLNPEQLTAMIDSGQFEVILALPIEAFEILREEKDPTLVIDWADLASDALIHVVETGLFRVATPSEFRERDTLSQVIALQNHEAIRKLMLLDRAEQDVLIELPTLQSREVLVALKVDDLSWLGRYFIELSAGEAGLIADSILKDLGVLLRLKTSESLRAKFPGVLTLAERNQNFRDILNVTGLDGFEKLSNLVAAAVESLTPEQLVRTIETGQFERLLSLPEATFEVLRELKDPAVVIAWSELAGEVVGNVVETELYRVASPSDFGGRDALNRVLALEEPEAVRKLMQLHQIERIVLLGLSTDQSRAALMALSLKDLAWLALYLAELAAEQKDPLVNYILQDTEIIPFFKENEVVRTKFPRVLMLSLNHPRFEEFLAGLNVDNIEKLAELIAAADATMTPENLSVFLESDEIKRVFLLPQKAFEILRFSGNPTELIDWDELAGESIDQVVDTGLYLIASPEDFSGPEELERVLEIEHVLAIQRLMAMDRKERESLLQLPAEEARSALLSDLSDDDLSWLASYLPDLSPSARTVFASNITQMPELVPVLRASEDLEQEFKRVLELAASLPPMRTILDNADPNDIAKLSGLVVIAEDNLAPDSLPELFASGQFASILSLPRESFKLLEWSKIPAVVIEWAQLAGDAIVEVAETELYKESDPGHFRNREELDKALALVGSETLTWLVLLVPKTRESVFSLDADPEITWLHDYSIDLTEENIVLVAHSIDQKPAMLSELDKENVGQTVKRSQNFEQALAFVSARIAEPQAWWPTAPMLSGAIDLSSGNQPWQLYWHYHQTQSIILLGALFLLVALALSVVWLHRRQHLPKIRDYLSRLLGGQA